MVKIDVFKVWIEAFTPGARYAAVSVAVQTGGMKISVYPPGSEILLNEDAVADPVDDVVPDVREAESEDGVAAGEADVEPVEVADAAGEDEDPGRENAES